MKVSKGGMKMKKRICRFYYPEERNRVMLKHEMTRQKLRNEVVR